MAGISFRLTRNDISPALTRMAAAAKRPESIFRAHGHQLPQLDDGQLQNIPTLARPTAWKEKRDGSPSNLQKNVVLSEKFSLTVSNTGATVASGVPAYAAIHQFGGIIKGNPWLRFQYAPGKWATVDQVTIPARPFFPVLNDKLTPKAEEKVRGAR